MVSASATRMKAAAIQLPSERSGHAPSEDLAQRRAGLAAAIAQGVWRTDPPPQEVVIGAVRTLRFDPPGPSRGLLVHMHGGAFRIGAPETVAPFASALARRCRVSVICPAYRLAPEHPFPAALVDGMAVIDALRDRTEIPLIVSGDS